VPITDTTTNRAYQKPNVANALSDDVGRIRAGLDSIDTDVAALIERVNIATNGAASTPPGMFSGTWFTGGTATTTKPQLLIEPTGTASTAWNTAGTGLGVNAPSGFTGRILDLQVAAVSSFVVTGSGRTVVGGTSNLTDRQGSTNRPGSLTIYQASGSTGVIIQTQQTSATDAVGGRLSLQRFISSSTAVSLSDEYGSVGFGGSGGGGATSDRKSALIACLCDGTASSTSMPGRVVISTTQDGTTTLTEALRITHDRVSCYNQATPTAVNSTATLAVADLKTGIITSTSAAATDMTLPTGTNTEAGFNGIYTNMTFLWSVINTGPSLVRILDGTGHTVTGSNSVAAGTSARFASRRTASNTFVCYRLS
jgi:hypothetical protein